MNTMLYTNIIFTKIPQWAEMKYFENVNKMNF